MDVLSGLLDGPRARDAFLLRAVMEPPWALRVEDRAPLTVVVQVSGSSWVRHDDTEPVLVEAGHVALVRGPDPYTMGHEPSGAVEMIIGPDQRCTSSAGDDLAELMSLGVRTWGNDADGSTVMLIGTYGLDGEVGDRVLRALPRLVVLPAAALARPLVSLLGSEIERDEPGQAVVLDRLLDLVIVDVLRVWFAHPGSEAPAWYRAQADPVVARAVQLLQRDPGQPWTIATLARACDVSRASLARRFTEVVGEPPMTFLTAWRLTLAADLLRDPRTTIAAAAHQVGYSSPFALSAAFKRVRGVTPQQHRAAHAARSA